MKKYFIFLLLMIWIFIHIPLISYGTKDLPIHMSYVGDEQSPVGGALHILQDKDILGLRNLNTLYYGPVFSIIALPSIVVDYSIKMISGYVHSANDYKDFILWDWGGIAWKNRVLAVISGFIGLCFLFKLLNTETINPNKNKFSAYIGTSLLALDFLYFEYTGFFKHWAFIVPILIGQLYFLIKLKESNYLRKYWIWELVLTVIGFGISYLGLVFQVIWLPLIFIWIKNKDVKNIRSFFYYFLALVSLCVLIVFWHPHAFLRLIGVVGGDITNTSTIEYTTEVQAKGFSFYYYLSIIVNNYFPVLGIFLILFFYLFNKAKIFKEWYFWSIAILFSVYLIVFGLISHHESRYVLPLITSAIVLTSILISRYMSGPDKNVWVSRIVMVLFSYTLIFNVVHIVKLDQIMLKGPKESEVINKLININKEDPSARILSYQYYLFGHMHTKDAYKDYSIKTGKNNLNLYQTIASTTLSKDIIPINSYYQRPDSDISAEDWKKYNIVVYKIEPRQEINQFDYFDENLLRLWNYDELSVKYIYLKGL